MRAFEWQAPEVDEGQANALAKAIGVRRLTARILIARGLAQATVAARFLAPRLADLRAPAGMADLGRVVERIVAALDERQKIGVFGDYDVDGVTTAAVLAQTLRAFGGDVIPRVANRKAGYGLGVADVARFADEGCALLITGDCGTSDVEALEAGRQRGLDVMVIDHHQIPSGETAAFALLNPHRTDDQFPFKGLASCGVAFYLAAALRSRLRDRGASFDPRDLLDLVALGSVADMVPLVEENRILVSAGLRVLSARKRPGITALCEAANISDGPLDAEDISFRLAPRLNAAGRLGEAQLALDVLLAPTIDDARRLTAELDERNRERQRIQETVWTAALQAAEPHAGDAALVVGADGWHPGVVGIIAAKLVEKFARPVVVIGFENGQGRGSARTIPGFNLYEALVQCRSHLTRYGGHAAAAGMSLSQERLEDFRRSFVAEAARALRSTAAIRSVAVDAVIDLGDFDVAMAEDLVRLAPFGAANAEPLFAFAGVTAQSTRRVGQGHLQLTLAQRGSISDAIGFGMADRDPGNGASVDVVATAELDTFRGERRTRLKIRHIHTSRPV
ncbi:MAG TPA: single-stranded-DNA-specific exonuclease RecJ [Polyangia bacterium]|nr:single-stranded-DNA-specific exonuclease RecJ [Polyangia bacterium]